MLWKKLIQSEPRSSGAGHGIHQHPNNFLSGVYYVRTPEDADTINFHDPRSQTSILRPPVVKLTAATLTRWWSGLRQARCYFFSPGFSILSTPTGAARNG